MRRPMKGRRKRAKESLGSKKRKHEKMTGIDSAPKPSLRGTRRRRFSEGREPRPMLSSNPSHRDRSRTPNKEPSETSTNKSIEFPYESARGRGLLKNQQCSLLADHTFGSSDEECEALALFLGLSPVDIRKRKQIAQNIHDMVMLKWPLATIQMFGSAAANLSTFRSDLDLHIDVKTSKLEQTNTSPRHQYPDETERARMLSSSKKSPSLPKDEEDSDSFTLNLKSSSDTPRQSKATMRKNRAGCVAVLGQLRNYIMANHASEFWVEFRNRAKIPILVLTDVNTKVQVDVGTGSVANPESMKITQYFQELYPEFRVQALLLKELLYQSSLHKVCNGGIGSYKLYFMLIYAFNHVPRTDLELARTDNRSLLFLVWHFLNYFSNCDKFSNEFEISLEVESIKSRVEFRGVRIDDCRSIFARAELGIRKAMTSQAQSQTPECFSYLSYIFWYDQLRERK